MTLLITVFAAIAATILWYIRSDARDLKIGTLALMFWGASIMWFADAIFEFAEKGAGYFTPPAEDMLNDSFLGFSVIALGLIVWLIVIIVSDPRGTIKSLFSNK